MKTFFEQTWKNWIKTNVDNGQDKNGIFKILLDEGYDYDAIVAEMQYKPTRPASQLINPFHAVKANHTQTGRRQSANYGKPIARDQMFIPNAENIETSKLEIYHLNHFLSAAESAQVIELIRSNLRPSGLSSYEKDTSFRTSRTCDLTALNHSFINDIDNRICQILGIDPSYSEGIQGQYYDEGEQFKAHTDYFEPNEIEAHGGVMGQRTYTFMIYLNDVEGGGETSFANIDTSFQPTTGSAVIWNSLNPDGSTNMNSLHQAHPVTKGYKAIITKWFRSNSRLPSAPPMFTKEANEFIPNYTRDGILQCKIPSELFAKVSEFYQANIKQEAEEYVPGDFIFNQSGKSTKSSTLLDLPADLRQEVHDQMKPMMETWCGKDLEPTFVYGIRTYKNHAVLKSHRDRIETHIISVILNVDQDVDEDWPLIIQDNYYRTHHVILKPGDMVFYEGARLEHGRPTAFKGTSFANIFCHFKPTDYIPRKLN